MTDWLMSPWGGAVLGAIAGAAEDLLAFRAAREADAEAEFNRTQFWRRVLSRALAGLGIGAGLS